MFVRTLYITTDPAEVGPALDVIAKAVPGMMAEQPGFDGIGIFADRTLGKIVTGSWWETEQALKDSDAKLRDRRMETLTPFVSSITVMDFEAAAYSRPASANSGGFRLERLSFAPDQVEPMVEAFKDVGLGHLRDIEGYQGASMLVNRTYAIASVSVLYSDLDTLAASRGPQSALRKAGLGRTQGVHLVSLEEYEVVELDLPTSNPLPPPAR